MNVKEVETLYTDTPYRWGRLWQWVMLELKSNAAKRVKSLMDLRRLLAKTS